MKSKSNNPDRRGDETISLRIESSMKEELRRKAEELGISVSRLVRHSVRKTIGKRK